jgi:nucleoside-diphosphate-sugar epimerase
MRVLVTGGAGYLGSTLVPFLLSQGHDVRTLDCLIHGGRSLLPVWAHPRFEFLRGDVRDGRAVRTAVEGVDAVVHLAAIVGDPACAREPERARSVNLDGSVALLDAARNAGVSRFIFASTCSNYGRMSDGDGYVDEDSALAPISLYAETKVEVERRLLHASTDGDLALTPLRFATVFGVSPRMRFDLTVNEFTAELVLHGRLTVYGEQFWRPYVHVVDAARAIALVLSAPRDLVDRRVFNVGSTDQNLQKGRLVELIRAEVPQGVVEYVHREEDPRNYRVRFDRVRQCLGFEVTRTVQDGISEVARLVRSGVIEDFADPRYRN